MNKLLKGRVIKNAKDKTIVVDLTRSYPHPKYKKIVRKSKLYHVHDPENKASLGSMVVIRSCRPISKTKHYTLD